MLTKPDRERKILEREQLRRKLVIIYSTQTGKSHPIDMLVHVTSARAVKRSKVSVEGSPSTSGRGGSIFP